jgi:diguanylate cyclase (GGDEF)-like protein/PAS domain S-box-containing protein
MLKTSHERLNKASTLLLQNCVDKMMRVNKAQYAVGYLIDSEKKPDRVVLESEVCIALPELLGSQTTLFNQSVRKLFCLGECAHEALFINELSMTTYIPPPDAKGFNNIRYTPIVEQGCLYAIIILVNVKMSPTTQDLVDDSSFIAAAVGMLKGHQLRTLSSAAQEDKIDHLLIKKILSNTFHPAILFSDELKVVRANSAAQKLFNANTARGWLPIDQLLEDTVPHNAIELFATINKFCFLGHLDCSQWHDVVFVLSPYQTVLVDIHLFEYKQAGTQYFGLMLNEKQPITEDTSQEEQYSSMQRFKALTNVVPTAIVQVDKHWQCSYINDTWTRYTTLDFEQSQGSKWLDCFIEDDREILLPRILKSAAQEKQFKTEIQLRTQRGNMLWVELHAAGLFNERYELTGMILTMQDITSSKHQAEKLIKLANYDHLTGLTNRAFFTDRLSVAMSRAQRHGLMAVMFIDLDKFKHVNDTLGHPTGDKVIQEVGKRLKTTIRDEDSIARLGGDEFAIILTDVHDAKYLVPIVDKILISINQPLSIDEHNIPMSCSIGIATSKDDAHSPADILKKADLALYKAKELGRNQSFFYCEQLETDSQMLVGLRDSLSNITQNHFSLSFQPQIDARTETLLGLEALARWSHPECPSVGPDVFIGFIENNGLMHEFSAWLFKEAIKITAKWHKQGLLSHSQKVAINLSANQLHLEDLADNIIQLFSELNAPTFWFSLEVTETAFIQDPVRAGKNLHKLEKGGFSIALDDFGTGYSSLSLLRQMPISTIKIDRSFVQDILSDNNDASIVLAVIGLGNMLNLNIVAEGVEDKLTCEWLLKHDCFVHQGYYFYKPLTERMMESQLFALRSDNTDIVVPIKNN